MVATKHLTNAQERLLKILEPENYEGWMEIYLAWGDYDSKSDAASFATTKLVVDAVLRSLERKGLATRNEDGSPVLTEAGAELKASL